MLQETLLNNFKEHFENKTNIRVIDTEIMFSWHRLFLKELNCEEMIKVAEYIKRFFSEEGKYSHLLPTLHGYKANTLALTVGEEQLAKLNLKISKQKFGKVNN